MGAEWIGSAMEVSSRKAGWGIECLSEFPSITPHRHVEVPGEGVSG